MTAILTTARLVCKDQQARKTVIEAFRKIIAYTTPNEPEVLQYVCGLPVDDSQGTEIYMIEEYANQAASDAHLVTTPVQDLIKLFTTSDVLASTPEVHNCLVSTKRTSGSPLPVSSDPAIVLVNTPYKTGSTTKALDGWRDAAQKVFSSANGLSKLIVVEDKETSSIRAEYVLKTWNDFEGFAAQSKDRENEADRSGPAEIVKIRAVDGFLGREDKSRL